MRHRLEQNIRNPVPVAVLELATRQREHIRPLVLDLNLGLAQRPQERHKVGEPQLMHQPLQPRPLNPLADDPQPQIEATSVHEPGRLNQRVMTFLLDKPPHAQDDGRPFRAGSPLHPVHRVDAVMGERDGRPVAGELCQVAMALGRAREYDLGVAHLSRKLLRRCQPDVLRVRRQSIGDSCQQRREAAERRRLVREMHVERRRAETHQPVRENRAPAQVRAREIGRRHHLGQTVQICPRPAKQKRRMRESHSKPRSALGQIGQILNLRPQPSNRLLPDSLLRTP